MIAPTFYFDLINKETGMREPWLGPELERN